LASEADPKFPGFSDWDGTNSNPGNTRLITAAEPAIGSTLSEILRLMKKGVMTELESCFVNWYWDGDIRVAVLSDGTIIRASTGLGEKIQQVLADRGERRHYIRFTQVAPPEGAELKASASHTPPVLAPGCEELKCDVVGVSK
jgi:hypothetical protein